MLCLLVYKSANSICVVTMGATHFSVCAASVAHTFYLGEQKMKRVIALLLAVVLVLFMAACAAAPEVSKQADNNENSSKQDSQPGEPSTEQKPDESESEVTYQKLEGKITGASVFNNGYALVCVNGDDDTTYCIDKEGNIIYQMDEKFSINGTISSTIVNGQLLNKIIGANAIYDMTGKATRPEDVGATKFYDIALEGGYILAEKVTADYASTKKEIGILNFDYEWVVEPSEEIYTAIEKDLSFLTAVNYGSYYHDGYIFFENSRCYLNIMTGEILNDIDHKTPSEHWTSYSTDGKYFDSDQNIMLDLSHHANVKLVFSPVFKNGKAPVFFHNVEAGAYFFTLVDETGNFQFDPVQVIGIPVVGYVSYDGQYLLISDRSYSVNRVQCYNAHGELVGSYYNQKSFSAELSNGVILIKTGTLTSPQCDYYNPDFTPLF